ncbi:hypothetical protein BG57_26460 [Caballeronia grimmiae]|uniref:Uncharacterized protein n=1 Tax=Caballeronia grimmiae TaxID=1071679 RepID=A0A069NDG0_9BURK|nr:hypothetical protein BG57_26460 [Caballeronia grimmiae]
MPFHAAHQKFERMSARRQKESKGFVEQAAFEARKTKGVVLTFFATRVFVAHRDIPTSRARSAKRETFAVAIAKDA